MQLHLKFLDLPAPETRVWEWVDDTHRTLAIDALAQLIAKAVLATGDKEQGDD